MSRFIHLIFLFLTYSDGGKSMHQVSTQALKPMVFTVNFPQDGGKWTDIIVSSFKDNLFDARRDVQFVDFSWSGESSTEDLLKNISTMNPSIIFLPDDYLYSMLASKISSISSAKVVFVTFYTNSDELNKANNEAGVVCNAPIEAMVRQARKMVEIRSVGVVGGPFANKISNMILSKLPADVVSEYKTTSSWDEYRKYVQEFSKKYDAVWPLAPFGVTNCDGGKVNSDQLNIVIEEISKITLGYGRISEFKRAIDMEIDPAILGSNAAALAYDHLIGKPTVSMDFVSYGLRVNASLINGLGASIPEDLQGFVSRR